MTRKLTTTIIAAVLAALMLAATAQASCTGTCYARWVENGVTLPPVGEEGASDVLAWGHVTIEAGSTVVIEEGVPRTETIGPIECLVAGVGRLYNQPAANGTGEIRLTAWGTPTGPNPALGTCEPAIPSRGCQVVEKMVLHGTGAALVSTETVRFGLEAEYACTYGGLPAAKGKLDSYGPTTELRPSLENGSSIGSAPARLMFGARAKEGEWVSGNLKLFAFYGGGIIKAMRLK